MLHLGLLLISFNLFLDLFSLVVDLRGQGVLNGPLLVILLADLRSHELLLLGALLLQVLVLAL